MGSVVGSIAGGLLGGSKGASSAPTPKVFQPANLTGENTTLLNLLNSNASNTAYSQYAPDYTSTFNNLYNSIYAPTAQTSANNAGAGYTATGNQLLSSAPQINSSALSLLPAVQQTLQMGFDPQGDLYKRTLQQLSDQSNVVNAQNGTTGSPYGASVTNKQTSDFNIDWQNQQLTRALQALSGAGTAVGQAASSVSTAGQQGESGSADILKGGSVPYDTNQTIGNNQNSALTALITGLTGQNTLNQQSISDLMQYLGLGATQSNAQAGVTNQTFQNQQQAAASGAAGGSAIGSQIGSLVSSSWPTILSMLG